MEYVNPEDINFGYLSTFRKMDLIELIVSQHKIIDNLGEKVKKLEREKIGTMGIRTETTTSVKTKNNFIKGQNKTVPQSNAI